MALLLALWAVSPYCVALSYGRVHLDDPSFLGPSEVQAGLSLGGTVWALTTMENANWAPLTWLSYQAEQSLFGGTDRGRHAVNLILHAAATMLLFAFLSSLTGRPGAAALGAALWAVHPLRVESVVWLSERRDVLVAVFCAATMWAYLVAQRRPRRWLSASVVVLQALAIASKPVAVILPLWMLMLDLWPLGRLRPTGDRSVLRLLAEKWPGFLLSLLGGVMAFRAQKSGGALELNARIPWPERVAEAAVSLIRHLLHLFWPVRLPAFYQWEAHSLPVRLAAWGTCAALGWMLFRMRRRHPALALGAGFFVVALLPVLGLIQVGNQALADRYSYLPTMGFSLAAAFEWPRSEVGSRWGLAVAAGICAALWWGARAQTELWRDEVLLWETTRARGARGPFVELNLAQVEFNAGRYEQAERAAQEALREGTGSPLFRLIGELRLHQGRRSEAIRYFREEGRHPRVLSGTLDLARRQEAMGLFSDAYRTLRLAERVFPASLPLLEQELRVSERSGDEAKTVREAVRIRGRIADLRPKDPVAQYNAGVALARTGRFAEALDRFHNTLRIDPTLRVAQEAAQQAEKDLQRQRP